MTYSPLRHNRAQYINGCRCLHCRLAATEYNRQRRAVNAAAREIGSVNPAHGKVGTYTNFGCRCDVCKEAMRVYHAQRRADVRLPA